MNMAVETGRMRSLAELSIEELRRCINSPVIDEEERPIGVVKTISYSRSKMRAITVYVALKGLNKTVKIKPEQLYYREDGYIVYIREPEITNIHGRGTLEEIARKIKNLVGNVKNTATRREENIASEELNRVLTLLKNLADAIQTTIQRVEALEKRIEEKLEKIDVIMKQLEEARGEKEKYPLLNEAEDYIKLEVEE